MQPDEKQLEIILEHLFKKQEQRDLVKAVVREGITVYEAEKRYGVSINTGTRYTKKYDAHLTYLRALGLNI